MINQAFHPMTQRWIHWLRSADFIDRTAAEEVPVFPSEPMDLSQLDDLDLLRDRWEATIYTAANIQFRDMNHPAISDEGWFKRWDNVLVKHARLEASDFIERWAAADEGPSRRMAKIDFDLAKHSVLSGLHAIEAHHSLGLVIENNLFVGIIDDLARGILAVGWDGEYPRGRLLKIRCKI